MNSKKQLPKSQKFWKFFFKKAISALEKLFFGKLICTHIKNWVCVRNKIYM